MTTDVLIIGAGFAGLTASRELSKKGYTVQVLEARDRVAGRTWLDPRLGRNLEMGGTWVHWAQPHVWAELTRYAIGVVPPADYEKAYWHAAGQSFQGSPDELMALLDGPNRELLAPSRSLVPLPYEPLSNPAVKAADQLTMSERIDALSLDPVARELLRSFWTLNFNGRLDEAAFTQALRWCSAACHNWLLMFEICSAYKIQGGTAVLAEAIAADSAAQLELNTAVAEIRHTQAGVIAVDREGKEYAAKKILVTLPLAALESIQIEPGLSSGKRQAAKQGQIGMGAKLWIKVKGRHERFVAMGPEDWPLNFVQAEYLDADSTTLVAFGPDDSAVDVEDAAATQELLRRWIPDIEVLDVAGHSWVKDEFARQTWAMHRTGYLTTSLTELQREEGNVYLAGSDYASGWGGFIDGAIESGLQAAEKISNTLKTES